MAVGACGAVGWDGCFQIFESACGKALLRAPGPRPGQVAGDCSGGGHSLSVPSASPPSPAARGWADSCDLLEPHFLSFHSIFQFYLQGTTRKKPPLHARTATALVSADDPSPLDTSRDLPIPLVSLRSTQHDSRMITSLFKVLNAPQLTWSRSPRMV